MENYALWSRVEQGVDDDYIWYVPRCSPYMVPAVTTRSSIGQLVQRKQTSAFTQFLPVARYGEEGRKYLGSVEVKHSDSTSIPAELWRAIREDHPGQGLIARAYSTDTMGTELTRTNFQLLVECHLQWHSRIPSPFLSATPQRERAVRLCQKWIAEGWRGVRLVRINSSDMVRDHDVKIWKVTDLCHHFSLEYRSRYEDEFIIHGHILEDYTDEFSGWSAP
jgi:hypothetical protein